MDLNYTIFSFCIKMNENIATKHAQKYAEFGGTYQSFANSLIQKIVSEWEDLTLENMDEYMDAIKKLKQEFQFMYTKKWYNDIVIETEEEIIRRKQLIVDILRSSR
jgi:6-phosphogluconolactonase/glucosamine-6-phosphate isomerase/deaminase